ncbi:hypothetical protein [Geobacter anodireducens]|uniref:Uncharacterized protein n=1 Tax=Geobacter anodireducens TaxID=1340425 RepID=A0ABR9NXI3_9BACT|nr:hypothetical protein [Geobacter anodireducens]MBE2888974.1 hypothetical protein [Geobacter anodireducens]
MFSFFIPSGGWYYPAWKITLNGRMDQCREAGHEFAIPAQDLAGQIRHVPGDAPAAGLVVLIGATIQHQNAAHIAGREEEFGLDPGQLIPGHVRAFLFAALFF